MRTRSLIGGSGTWGVAEMTRLGCVVPHSGRAILYSAATLAPAINVVVVAHMSKNNMQKCEIHCNCI